MYIGHFSSNTPILNALQAVWTDLNFFPEEFDQSIWLKSLLKSGGNEKLLKSGGKEGVLKSGGKRVLKSGGEGVLKSGGNVNGNAYYPLRPELIESIYHQYIATGDRSWLQAGLGVLESLERCVVYMMYILVYYILYIMHSDCIHTTT